MQRHFPSCLGLCHRFGPSCDPTCIHRRGCNLIPWENSNTQVFEVYSPTECTVFSSLDTQLSSEDPSDIGKPVGGGLWITDSRKCQLTATMRNRGRIITDHRMANGYLDDVAKTMAAFVTPV